MSNLHIFRSGFWGLSYLLVVYYCKNPCRPSGTCISHIPLSSDQPIQLETENKMCFSEKSHFLCGFGTATSQEPFKLRCSTDHHYMGMRGCFPEETSSSTTKELTQLFNYAASIGNKKKRAVKYYSQWEDLTKAPETSVACKTKRRCFCQRLWTERVQHGHLGSHQTPLASSSCFGGVVWESLWDCPGGHGGPRVTCVHFCLGVIQEHLFGHFPLLPRLKKNRVLHILAQSCCLCLQLGNREEKKTLLSSVNCFFVTEYTSKTL